MPVNGLVFAADAMELYLASSASGSHTGDGTGNYTHGATGNTYYAPDIYSLNAGFSFSVGGSSSTNQWSVTYTGPGSPSGTTWTGSGWGTVDAKVVLSDVRLYADGAAWYLTATYEVFAQGVSRITGSIAESGAGLSPAFVPLIGVPFGFYGVCTAGTSGSVGTYYSFCSECTATATGGWRFKPVGGGWETLPVTIASATYPSVSPCAAPTPGVVDADSTYGATVESYYKACDAKSLYDSGTATGCTVVVKCDGVVQGTESHTYLPPQPWHTDKREQSTESRSASVTLIPDLVKAIKRLGYGDTGALLYRGKMPQTTGYGTGLCNRNGVEVTTNTGYIEVHPDQAEYLTHFKDAANPIEDTFGYPTLAPITTAGGKSHSIVYTAVVPSCNVTGLYPCGGVQTFEATIDGFTAPPDNESEVSSVSYAFPQTVSTNIIGYMNHSLSLARYLNSWCNPHWSFALATYGYDVDGTPETWNDYGSKVGSQHIHNISAGITAGTRNHLASEALANDGNGAFCDSYFGGFRWVGQSRFLTLADSPRTSFIYSPTESSMFAGTDCSLSHGLAITLTPSAASCEMALTLGSFTQYPFMWAHLADRFTFDWSATNVSSIKVYLEGSEGSRVLLNDNDPGIAKAILAGPTTKYAGSWKQDYGADGVTDEGADDLPEGISASVMASAERSFAVGLLPAFSPVKVVFVIEPVTVGDPITIEYPRLEYTKSADRLLTYETAHQGSVIHPNGPGIRFGNWNTGTSGTVDNPPAVYDGYTRPNAIDWRIFRNLVVLGLPHDDSLSSDLVAQRDTLEGQSVGQERGSSHGFLLPPTGEDWAIAIVSSLAEVPPLGCFPFRQRNETTWLPTGDFGQVVWLWAQEPDYFVNPAVQVDLYFEPSIWTAPASSVAGWKRTSHVHALDNTEAGARVRQGAKDYATVRPWRGSFSVLPPSATVSRMPSNFHNRRRQFMRANVEDGIGLVFRRAMFSTPNTWQVETIVIDDDTASWPHISEDLRGAIWLCYTFDGDTYIVFSTDGGATFSDPVMGYAGATVERIAHHVQDGRSVAVSFLPDGGSSTTGVLKVQFKGLSDAIYGTANTAKAEDGTTDLSIEDAGFDISFAPDAGGRLILTATKAGETAAREWMSWDNGRTFKEV